MPLTPSQRRAIARKKFLQRKAKREASADFSMCMLSEHQKTMQHFAPLVEMLVPLLKGAQLHNDMSGFVALLQSCKIPCGL